MSDREQALETTLRDIYKLIESHELVRNPMMDGQSDWFMRMVNLVGVLKRAQELLGGGKP